MIEYSPKPKYLGGKVKIELDLSNYATKVDLKNKTLVDTLDFVKNDLANLKSDVDKLDINKLKNVPNGLSSSKSKLVKLDIGKIETTPSDLSKLSNVVKNMSLKRLNIMN